MIQREREIEEGRLSKRQVASKWSDAMVKEILDNDFYIGTFRLKKRARNTVHGKDKRVPKEEQCILRITIRQLLISLPLLWYRN